MITLPSDNSTKIDLLRKNSYFFPLNESAFLKLCPWISLRKYSRGEIILWEGDPCAGLHIIRTGSIKLFKTSPQGRELIVKIFSEGDTFNEVPVFDEKANPISAAALDECEIWVINPDAIRSLMDEYPELCRTVLLNLASNLRLLVGLVSELSFYQVTNRLARLLIQMPHQELGGDGGERITQDQIAARLGTVREVVARSLKELERSGAILARNRRIRIIDRSILENWISGPGCL